MKVVILFLVATLVERSYGFWHIPCVTYNPCSQICNRVWFKRFRCSCYRGFQVNPYNRYHCDRVVTSCQPGYQLLHNRCLDINECLKSPCQHKCTNKQGSYSCSCNSGYQPVSGSPSRCEPIAATCQPGYQPNPANLQQCIDINECLKSPCQHTCTNSIGSYSCSCNSGYQPVSGSPSRCEPITATCQPGYQPNPANIQQCIDIDECARNNPCSQRCMNLEGSYRCSCNSGYAISDKNRNQCEAITICTNPIDIAILIDSPGSMDEAKYPAQLQFIANLVRHFAVGPNNTRFAAVVFGEDVKDLFPLHSKRNVDEVVKAILAAPYTQAPTNTHVALDFIRTKSFFSEMQGGRQFAPDRVLVVTDDQPNDPIAAESSAAALRNAGVEIIALGIGNKVNVEGLRRLATSDSHVFTSPTFDDLPYIKQRLAAFLCSV